MKRAILLITTILLIASNLGGCGGGSHDDTNQTDKQCKNINPLNGQCED